MKVALVYDRINKFGGAERVLTALHRLYPDAPIFTLVHEPSTSTWAKGIKVIPTFLNIFPFLRTRHEWLAPVATFAFETLDLSPYDVVISVTSSDAKAVITKPHQLHICYCLTPTRYFWSGEGEYSADKKMRFLPSFLKKYLRSQDLLISTRPDEYIAISKEVKNRIKKYYSRDSSVIYPPIEDKFYSNNPVPLKNREYYLLVGRLVPYKKADLVVNAFSKLNLPLVVVGSGSEEERLKSLAGKSISFVGQVDDRRLIEYYRHAKAVIFPQEEDLGLIPIEAQALGTPVIAYSRGGSGETVIHGQTGYLFDSQSVSGLIQAVENFRKMNFSPSACVENAKKFNFQKFKSEFTGVVNALWEKYSGTSPTRHRK